MSLPSSASILPPVLSASDIKSASITLTALLTHESLSFCIMSSAAIILHRLTAGLPLHRPTTDLHIAITPPVDFDVYTLSSYLINKYPDLLTVVDLYGVPHPGLRVQRPGGVVVAELQMHDARRWTSPEILDDEDNPEGRVEHLAIHPGVTVPVCSAAWLLRDKIIAQAERRSTAVYLEDQRDVEAILPFVGNKELRLRGAGQTAALRLLRREKPDLETELRRTIDCKAGLGEWIWNRQIRRYYRFTLVGEVEWDEPEDDDLDED